MSIHPSLKRARSSSQPPSPTSTSSPKRAASEDTSVPGSDSSTGTGYPSSIPYPDGHHHHTHHDLSNPVLRNMHSTAPGSSPLRLESDAEDAGWVQRTENVHLTSSDPTEGDAAAMDVDQETEASEQGKLKEQYDQLLGAVSPPFDAWKRYYIIPADILKSLKTLALDPESAAGGADSVPRIDLLPLIKDDQGVKVNVIGTETTAGGATSLAASGKEETLWSIKDGLLENEDFMFISPDGWNKLLEWYGPYTGPALPRFCQPGERFQMAPPVYTLYLVQRASGAQPATQPAGTHKPIKFTVPSAAPISIFLSFVKALLGSHLAADAITRVWTLDVSNTDSDNLDTLSALEIPSSILPSLSGRWLKPDMANLSCAEAGLDNGDAIAVEIGKSNPFGGEIWSVDVNERGKAVEKSGTSIQVPTAPAPLFSKPAAFGGDASRSRDLEKPATRSQTRSRSRRGPKHGTGLVGLINLGNTCFMNSATQCLSNTPELNDYFLSGVYRNELNPDNPLGMQGQIAEAFGGTIEALWAPSSAHSSHSPRQLKWTTSRFAPQFAGYGQHDTQEFIAFLLDGLHEDLNRIKKKPYIEKPDWKPGGGDRELAELGKECWEGYKKRNDSVIVDLFQGQLKSTLVCPECHKESITLDPFMYLTVPLPIAQTRTFKCKFVPLNPDKAPVKLKLLISQNASFAQIKDKIGQLMDCNSANMVGFDLWKGGVYTWWLDADHNSECKDADEAVFYELAVPVISNRKAVGVPEAEHTITVPVYTSRTVEPSRGSYRNHDHGECVAWPFFITLTKAEATDPVAVREAITKGYARLIRPEARADMWVPSGSRKAAVALPAMEDEEPVTEIHLEGDQTRVEITTSSEPRTDESNDGSSTADSNLLSSPEIHRNASFNSISDAASIKSGKSGRLVPRGDLFKVHVADASSSEGISSFSFKNKDPHVIPFWKGTASQASNSWSRLESRRKAKKNIMGHIASGFKSMVSSTQSLQSEDEPSPPATPVGPPLVVRPGEGIFCEWSVKRYNEFFNTSLTGMGPSEEIVDPAISKDLAKKKEGKAISLDDCLDEFSKEETLGQDDLWYCPVCKKHQAATKKLEIYQAPDVLVICIKRFGSSRRLSDKLDQFVSFPIEGLDLDDRVEERKIARSLNLTGDEAVKYGIEPDDEPLVYDLYAVDNHFGGMGGGHYTAFCKNKLDGQWYNYDDSRVSKANVEAVQSRAAYLLFYRRRTSRPIGGISRIKAEEASRAATPVDELSSSSDDEAEAEASTATRAVFGGSSGPGSSSLAISRQSSGGSTSSTDPIGASGDTEDRWSANVGPPAYNADSSPPTPALPSPTISDADVVSRDSSIGDSSDDEARPAQSVSVKRDELMAAAARSGASPSDLAAVGSTLGFGNTAWGIGGTPALGSSGIHHSFATDKEAGKPKSINSRIEATSVDGFEVVNKDSSTSTSDEDAEMVSAPESPQ